MTPEDWDNVKKFVDDYLESMKPIRTPPAPQPFVQPHTEPAYLACRVCGITWQAGKAYGYCCMNAGCPTRPWS